MPRVLVVQHEAVCPPAHLGRWLADAGAEVVVVRPDEGDDVPDGDALADVDALVVLGGTQGAYDDHAWPWLPAVREAVRTAAAVGLPTLGVCLGHQLAAVALGGRVERNPLGQQVGVLPVGWLPEAGDDALLGPVAAAARAGVQWNHDVVVELPPGAVALARTGRGELQAARLAPTVWGVQLHPEADLGVVTAWAAGDRDDHLERGVDQDALLAQVDAARAELDAAWRPLAEGLVRLAADRAVRGSGA